MEKIIKKYEHYLKASGKNLQVILAEKLRANAVVGWQGSYLFLSETDKEWVIHPVILLDDESVSTGNGSYLFKDKYTYEDAKEIFRTRS